MSDNGKPILITLAVTIICCGWYTYYQYYVCTCDLAMTLTAIPQNRWNFIYSVAIPAIDYRKRLTEVTKRSYSDPPRCGRCLVASLRRLIWGTAQLLANNYYYYYYYCASNNGPENGARIQKTAYVGMCNFLMLILKPWDVPHV